MSACATPGKTRSFLCSRRLWLSKLESACLSDSCCTRVLLEEGLSARGEKELLDSRHLSLFGVLHACPCSRRVGSTLGGVDAARWGKPSFSARENFILLGVLHASSYRSVPTLEKLSFFAREDSVLLSVLHARFYPDVRALGPGVRLRSARGETELLGSRKLCSSQRASRSSLSQRARAGTWCPLAQRSRRNGASRLEKTFAF